MQEIHQICYWNELETNFCLVLITIKGVCNFFYWLKHEEQTNIKVKLVSSSFQYQVRVFHIRVFTHIDNPFFPHFG